MGSPSQAMKVLFVCALIAVAVAIDSETMSTDVEGTTELLQEHAKVEAKAKEGVEAHAKDTLTIWGKEVSMQKVQLAKKQLHHVMKHISAKRPQLLSSISTIQELTDHPELLGEGKLNGGYKKLRKVLWKIDQLEQELFDEWEMLRQKCDDAWNASEKKLNADIERYETMKREVREHRNGIEEDKSNIKASENKEVGVWAARLEDSKEETTAGYDKYWIESDDRAAVRN